MDFGGAAKLTLGFCRLLGQDVALKRLRALDGARTAHFKALGCSAFGLHFWHANSFICLTAAGGETISRLEPEDGLCVATVADENKN